MGSKFFLKISIFPGAERFFFLRKARFLSKKRAAFYGVSRSFCAVLRFRDAFVKGGVPFSKTTFGAGRSGWTRSLGRCPETCTSRDFDKDSHGVIDRQEPYEMVIGTLQSMDVADEKNRYRKTF